MSSPDHFAKSPWMLTLAALTGAVVVLYLAKGILLPLTLAALLSFVLAPVCSWLERRKVGRVPSVLVTAVLAFTLLGIGVWAATVQIMDLVPRIPEYQQNIETKLHAINDQLSGALGKVRKTTEGMGHSVQPAEPEAPQAGEEKPQPVRVVQPPSTPFEVIRHTFGSTFVVLGSAGIVIVLVLFFLMRRDDLRDRFIRLVGAGQVTATTKALEDAGTRVSRFLLTQLCINVTFGLPIGIGLYFIGLPHAILWGILATALRFIPYVGAWSAAAAPLVLSMAISPGWTAPLLTLGLFVILELFVAYVVEPWMFGKNTGVSSVAILVAAVFWTWLWGPLGLLVATPLTVCLLVIGKHVPQLSFLDTLLGNEPVFELGTRVYQRLLAGDQEEAAELVLDELEHRPLVDVYDTVLLPALVLAETHRYRGEHDEGRYKFIMQSLRTSIEEVGERPPLTSTKATSETTTKADGHPPLASSADSSPLCVLCLPAHDEADEIAGLMLAQVLETRACRVHVVSVAALDSDVGDLVEQHKADVVCVSSTPPAAVMHARHVCKRLNMRVPEVQLVVGLWATHGDLGKAQERIGCGAVAQVVSTLAAAERQILARVKEK